jgi:hypothetical protein
VECSKRKVKIPYKGVEYSGEEEVVMSKGRKEEMENKEKVVASDRDEENVTNDMASDREEENLINDREEEASDREEKMVTNDRKEEKLMGDGREEEELLVSGGEEDLVSSIDEVDISTGLIEKQLEYDQQCGSELEIGELQIE